MHESGRCPNCALELPADAPEGLCPSCLFKQALEDSDVDASADQSGHSPAPVFVPPAPADLARYFPQLEILELLGQGGMGAVYKARQTKLDRLIAVKVLPPEVARDPAFAERFMREARSLARLNHPNIVTIYDFGETNGLFYFSMEFVDGQNARQLMHAGKLSQAQTLPIVSQVCDALRYAHDEGVVHRDIKPENILLDKRGRVKIADFGLAKLVGLTPTFLTLTGAHEVMGTLYYMAPEQTRRSHQVDHRADLYSLGVVCYEMLTGELPLGRFAPPSQKASVDARLDAIVLRALAREPEQRYQDAGILKQDVDAIAVGTAPVAAKPEPVAVAATWPSVRFHIPRATRKGKKYHGAIYRDEQELIVEFEEEGIAEDSEIHVKRIPISGIASLGIHWNWELGYNELVIKPTRLSVLSGLPAGKSGRGRMRLDLSEHKAARRLADSVRNGIPLSAEQLNSAERSKLAIVAPATGLLIAGILAIIANLVLFTSPSWSATGHNSHMPAWYYFFFGSLAMISFGISGFLIYGAVRMLQHRSYSIAVATSIVAMVPWSPAWLLAFPMGLWALILLRKRAIMEVFLDSPVQQLPNSHATLSYVEQSRGGVVGLLRSMGGYFLSMGPRTNRGADTDLHADLAPEQKESPQDARKR
jgi:serine/threonine protein kinase